MRLALPVVGYSIQIQGKAMKSSKKFYLFFTVALCVMGGARKATAAGALGDDHPAVAIALDYVNYVSMRRYEVAAAQIKPEYLDRQLHKYVRAVRATPSVATEEAMLGRLGVQRIREVEAMDGSSFFVAHQQALDKERRITPNTRKKMEDSFRSELLGGVRESDSVVHVLIRTRHETLNAVISELLMVSLELVEGKWLVAPEHQELRMRPLITGELPAEIEVDRSE